MGNALAHDPAARSRSALYFAGQIARLMRESMLTAMQSEFVTAARAKGLGETALLFKHVFRIALLPVVSYSGPMLADLLTGSFIVENIFQIPGIGVFLVNSSLNRITPSSWARRCCTPSADRPEPGRGLFPTPCSIPA